MPAGQGSAPDFGRTASDYARYRAGFPDSFFERLEARGRVPTRGRCLDLGTGTGTVARGLALRGAEVIGLDISRELLVAAGRLADQAGVRVTFLQGRAESLCFPAETFALVTAGQSWHWFEQPAAVAEAWRVLVPGGYLVIAYFDWIPLAGNVVEATEQVIRKHNPAWEMGGGDGLHGAWLRQVAEAGFRELETFSYDLDVPYTHEAWRGRVRASAGVAASLAVDAIEEFDRELAALLEHRFPDDPLAVLHRVWVLEARKPG